jgi:hypothetical protein
LRAYFSSTKFYETGEDEFILNYFQTVTINSSANLKLSAMPARQGGEMNRKKIQLKTKYEETNCSNQYDT